MLAASSPQGRATAAPAVAGAAGVGAPGWRLRRHGAMNWRGLWSHAKRGVLAFVNDGLAYLGGPLITSAMFLAVFVLAIGGDAAEPDAATALTHFIGPGILAFMILHQAFQHAAAMLVEDKMEGVIADILMAPLSAAEVFAGYVLAAVTTAFMVGLSVLLLLLLVAGLPVAQPLALLGFALLGALLFALIGTLVGLWAQKWDHYSAAESFLILPLGVLSGAFFSLESVDEAWRWVIALNPAHYIIEGFRWSMIGEAVVAPLTAAAVLLTLDLVLAAFAWRLFAIGYRLKP